MLCLFFRRANPGDEWLMLALVLIGPPLTSTTALTQGCARCSVSSRVIVVVDDVLLLL